MLIEREDLAKGVFQVGFDGMAMPVQDPLVVLEAESGPVQSAGIVWTEHDGRLELTIEFQLRGQEPCRFHLAEQDDGAYEISTPPIHLAPPQR